MRVRPPRYVRVLTVAAALGLLAASTSGALPGLLPALGYVLPPLLLAFALLLRCYPGERILLALRARAGTPRRRLRVTPPAAARRPRPLLPRGGGLIAFSLAVRPPPPGHLPAPR